MTANTARLAILSHCLEYLHRHPVEVELDTEQMAEIIAYSRLKDERDRGR